MPSKIPARDKQTNPTIQSKIDSLENRVGDLENELKQYDELDKRLKNAEEKNSLCEVERLAAKKLIEISEKQIAGVSIVNQIIGAVSLNDFLGGFVKSFVKVFPRN